MEKRQHQLKVTHGTFNKIPNKVRIKKENQKVKINIFNDTAPNRTKHFME